jgi:hypothetical protein
MMAWAGVSRLGVCQARWTGGLASCRAGHYSCVDCRVVVIVQRRAGLPGQMQSRVSELLDSEDG